MLRALAAQLGLDAVAGEVRPPSHRVGPPETLTHAMVGDVLDRHHAGLRRRRIAA